MVFLHIIIFFQRSLNSNPKLANIVSAVKDVCNAADDDCINLGMFRNVNAIFSLLVFDHYLILLFYDSIPCRIVSILKLKTIDSQNVGVLVRQTTVV